MAMDDRNPKDALGRMLSSGDWVESLKPLDLEALLNQVESVRRSRRRRNVLIATVPVTAALAVGAVALPDWGPARTVVADHDQQAASSPDPRGFETSELGGVAACQASALAVSTGRSGAWHGMTSQQVDVRNTADANCTLAGSDIAIDIITSSGERTRVDLKAVADQSIDLGGGQAAWLMFGAIASCEEPEPVIARELEVTLRGQRPVALAGAWVAMGCGAPTAIDFRTEPPKPDSQSASLTATIGDVGAAAPDSTLTFTVSLNNGGDIDIRFDENCPSYTVGLKAAGTVETSPLNCAELPAVPAGESVKLAMQTVVPEDATGEDWLSWSLDGYAAVDGVRVLIK